MTIVPTICATFCSVRVTSSVMSAFVCSVSLRTREMIWQQENSVLCVAADSYYEAADYIRDYDEFLKTVQAKG